MRALDLQIRPGPPAVITLDRADIDPVECRPKPRLLVDIADRLERGGDETVPGYAVIRNPLEVLPGAREVVRFQKHLMEDLLAFATRHRSAMLKRPDFLHPDVGSAERRRIRDLQPDPRIWRLQFDGVTSHKSLHMDGQSHVFVSLCYGRRSRVIGGVPRFVDVLAMSRAWGCRVEDLVKRPLVPYDGFYPGEVYGALPRALWRDASAFETRLVGLSENAMMPIVVFSNRFEDGLLHGATPVRWTGNNPIRRLHYYTIAY